MDWTVSWVLPLASLARRRRRLKNNAFCVAAEELYFRGWLQPLLCARWGVWAGVIVTALLFAGLHVAGGARAPMSLLNLLLYLLHHQPHPHQPQHNLHLI